MTVPTFTMKQLLQAGVHFGHTPRRWNPKMSKFIFGERGGIHIIDLQKTVPLLYQALSVVRDSVASGGRVLFVGTKRQASPIIAEAANNCGQYFVNHRWLGGMLTNWKTISQSIKRLKEMTELLENEEVGLTKKEVLNLTRKKDKLEKAIGGIKDMGGSPTIIVVIDTNKEEIAIQEAKKLGIPVVAVVDSNSDPDRIDYPVPGNDDSIRAIKLYCELFSEAVLDGLQEEVASGGKDLGEAEDVVVQDLPTEEEMAAEATTDAKADEEKAKTVAKKAEPKAKKAETKAKKAETKAKKEDDSSKVEEVKEEAKKDTAKEKKTAAKPKAKKVEPKAKKAETKAKKEDDSSEVEEVKEEVKKAV